MVVFWGRFRGFGKADSGFVLGVIWGYCEADFGVSGADIFG